MNAQNANGSTVPAVPVSWYESFIEASFHLAQDDSYFWRRAKIKRFREFKSIKLYVSLFNEISKQHDPGNFWIPKCMSIHIRNFNIGLIDIMIYYMILILISYDIQYDHIGQWNEKVSIVRYKKRRSKSDDQVIDDLVKTSL